MKLHSAVLNFSNGLIRFELSDDIERRHIAIDELQTILKCYGSRMRESWGHEHERTIGICEDIENMVRMSESVLTEDELTSLKCTLIDNRGRCVYRNAVH